MKEEKYVFIYGGKNKDWIQEFNKLASTFAIELNKEAKIPIGLFNLESLQSNIITRFWTQVEGLFVTKINKTKDTVTQQVEKLLSYKSETGWALLIKGPFVVAVGHGTTVLKTVAEFEKWKELVIKKGFEFAFKEYLDKVSSSLHICSHLQIPNINGKIPDTIECPECHRTMEVFISYKCCHNGNTTAKARALIWLHSTWALARFGVSVYLYSPWSFVCRCFSEIVVCSVYHYAMYSHESCIVSLIIVRSQMQLE